MRRGQVLIVVLLTMIVVMTVGISIASRSVTEVSTTTTQHEAIEALDAAEAGLEKKLSGGDVSSGTYAVPSGFGTFTISTPIPTPTGMMNKLEPSVLLGEGDTLTLSTFKMNGNTFIPGYESDFYICWGEPGTSSAIEVAAYYLLWNPSRMGVKRDLYTAVNISGAQGEKVVDGNPACNQNAYNPIRQYGRRIRLYLFTNVNNSGSNSYGLGIDPGARLVQLRIRMLNTDHSEPVGLFSRGVGNRIFLPQEGESFSVLGTVGSTNQKINVNQGNSDLPAIFDSAIFSGQNIEVN